MKKRLITALLLCSLPAMANNTVLQQKLGEMGLRNIEVKPSPIAGINTIIAEQGVFYATENGRYVFDGSLYELTPQGAVDVARGLLLEKLAKYEKEMIVFPARQEKYVVTVFMDITCHYCRLLHQQVKDYNDLGITLRYLAFPRGGLNNQTARQMEAIWTEKDPAFAFNQAEQGNLPKTLKDPNIVKKHYELGVQFGVRGTPSMITAQGELIGGYLSPKDLLATLQQ
ncbi:bifunctional protein-disulfide isomerase/oxidoreductase DsbC [Volucribacter amazonae]|uniref:Thiol:disulfide interchange protein n=1 Tax=Volucribacter amazonae TaxID=256731 RepID=A0A9X4SIH0_9PAST|nr:bifunctional protein-disulfide isomerase/oxidoreductase DsbC [Volucribacter amazonae]MDG6895647.1 protein-disulfide isomerase [Volucribacter amazonae]